MKKTIHKPSYYYLQFLHVICLNIHQVHYQINKQKNKNIRKNKAKNEKKKEEQKKKI